MTNNYTLYYPTIEFSSPSWLWSAALIWDRVYRIVPNNYKPEDCQNVKELISSSDFISNIDPRRYSSEACDEFIKGCKRDKWWAAALDVANYKKEEYVKLHKDKADVKLRELILAQDAKDNDWLKVPSDLAAVYMLYLANHIAKNNNLSLSTCYPEAWCGSNFFQNDGNISECEDESQTQLACITINHFIPANIMNVSPSELAKFRETKKNERQRFFESIKELSTKISACQDEKVIQDIIVDYYKEIEESIKEYKRSMIDIKAVGWMGVQSLMVPALMPVMDAFFKLPESTIKNLSALGLGIGVVGALWEERKQIKEKEKTLSMIISYN
jgi:hypothetical protein